MQQLAGKQLQSVLGSSLHTVVEGHVELVEGQSALGGLAIAGVQLAVAVEPHDVHCRLIALDHLWREDTPGV